jgi:hypothetical protein
MVWTAADAIEAINNKAAAGESVASKAGTSSLIAVRERTSFIITVEELVTIGFKGNTDIAGVKRQRTEINVNNVIV